MNFLRAMGFCLVFLTLLSSLGHGQVWADEEEVADAGVVEIAESDGGKLEDSEKQLGQLNQVGKHFQEEVAFACQFAYRAGTSKDWDAAWLKASQPVEVATHRMLKREGLFLLESLDAGDTNAMSMMSVDGIQIVLNEPPRNYMLLPPDNKESDRFLSYYDDPINFSSFFMGGGKDGQLIPPLMKEVPDQVDANTIVRTSEEAAEMEVIQTLSTSLSKWKMENRIVLEIMNGLPTIRELHYQEFNDRGDLRMQSRCVLSDFQDCNGVSMASVMTRALGPVQDNVFMHWRWEATSFDATPSQDAFVLHVPSQIPFRSNVTLPKDRRITPDVLRGFYKSASAEFHETLLKSASSGPVASGSLSAGTASVSLVLGMLAVGVALCVVGVLFFRLMNTKKQT